MLRSFILGLFVVAAAVGMSADSNAARISRNNPYRSFNVSGINYGSQKWERTHSQSSASRGYRSNSFHYYRGR